MRHVGTGNMHWQYLDLLQLESRRLADIAFSCQVDWGLLASCRQKCASTKRVLGTRYLMHLLTKGQVQIDVARLIPPELVQLLTAGLADFGAAVSFLALLLDLIRQANGQAPKPRHDIKAVLINIILTYTCTRLRLLSKSA